MNTRREKTEKLIIDESLKLFTKKGFKNVTMQDICNATGLSRGGLYHYFSNTRDIFKSLFEDPESFTEQIMAGDSAKAILENVFKEDKEKILSNESSLSIALYEYSTVDRPFIELHNIKEKQRWCQLISYGIGKGEFKPVDPEQIADLIMYTYQGARMWADTITFSGETVDHLHNSIRELLYK